MTQIQWNDVDLNEAEKADISAYLETLPMWGKIDEIYLELFGIVRRDKFMPSKQRDNALVFNYDSDHRFYLLLGATESPLQYANSKDRFSVLTKLRPVKGAEPRELGEMYLFPELNDYEAPGMLFLSMVEFVA